MSVPLKSIRDQALEVGRGWSGPAAESSWALTATLFDVLADDRELLALASGIPAERLPALLFVASVQYVVARHPDDPFSAYYPVAGGRQPPLDGRLAERYRTFCLEHKDELADVWSRHVYQMNEVARNAQIALALGVVHDLAPERKVTLIDLGTGAGFGLFPDFCRYAFSDGVHAGAANSPVRIDVAVQGILAPRCRQLPVIEHRVGIDINPIDLHDDEASAWLTACLPPESGALARAAGAIDLVRNEDPNIMRGSVEEVLGDVLARQSDTSLVCLIDAYTAVFFEEAEQQGLRDLISSQARSRDLVWISLDPLVPLGTRASATVQGVRAPDRLIDANRRGGVFGVLSITGRLDGELTERLLATAHPSGTQMEWIDTSSAT